jgi:hypothetical protein
MMSILPPDRLREPSSMTLYVIRRFLNYAILSLIATCMAYVLASIALDPAARFYGINPRPPQSSIDASLNAMGVNPDVPIIVRLWNWLVGLFTQFSMGTTVGGAQVTAEIAARSGRACACFSSVRRSAPSSACCSGSGEPCASTARATRS